MKRARSWTLGTLGLGLLLAVPAIPQDAPKPDLAQEVEAMKKTMAEQEVRLKELEAYALVHKAEAAELARQLREADRLVFLYPAPNTDSRKALLTSLTRFADSAATGTPPPKEEPQD